MATDPTSDPTGDPALTMLVAFFATRDGAARARHTLRQYLQSRSEPLYDSVIVTVNARHRARVYDPRRVIAGAATATLTWGLFGLLTGSGAVGTIVSALSGAVAGGLYAYLHEHVLTESTLGRIGARLPADSSGLALFTRVPQPEAVLAQDLRPSPTSISLATIAPDLTAQVQPDPRDDAETDLTMALIRYPEQGTAAERQAAQRSPRIQVELAARVETSGRIHIDDPVHGIRAFARSDVVAWGGFGIVFGAIAGAANGAGWIGLAGGALAVGVTWGLFGLLAGALYGLWAGRAVSGRRLHGLTQLLVPDTSNLLIWVDGALADHDLQPLTTPGCQQLVLGFAGSGTATSLKTG